jgi:hypothetical protein
MDQSQADATGRDKERDKDKDAVKSKDKDPNKQKTADALLDQRIAGYKQFVEGVEKRDINIVKAAAAKIKEVESKSADMFVDGSRAKVKQFTDQLDTFYQRVTEGLNKALKEDRKFADAANEELRKINM